MSKETLAVVDAYHDAWTTNDFDQAMSLLSPCLIVEVPINEYPTREGFAAALARFASQTNSVHVLSKMTAGNEAMILYDMDINGLGLLRVVEHFTVADRKIVRLRQIHDTAPLRVGAYNEDATAEQLNSPSDLRLARGYSVELVIGAPRQRVYQALTTLDGLTGWWATTATGTSDSAGSRFELGYAGLDETIIMRVDAAITPSSVFWTCLRHTGLRDWDGTKVVFELHDANNADSTRLTFRHVGLVPELDCFEQCHAGWEHFLSSLKTYTEDGRGTPFRRKQ